MSAYLVYHPPTFPSLYGMLVSNYTRWFTLFFYANAINIMWAIITVPLFHISRTKLTLNVADPRAPWAGSVSLRADWWTHRKKRETLRLFRGTSTVSHLRPSWVTGLTVPSTCPSSTLCPLRRRYKVLPNLREPTDPIFREARASTSTQVSIPPDPACTPAILTSTSWRNLRSGSKVLD